MFLKKFFVCLAVLMLTPAWASAFRGHVQTFDETGTIFWGNGEITVTRQLEIGESEEDATIDPLAVRKAVSNARKQMLDMIMSTRISSKRTIHAFLSEDAELAARVRGAVQNSPLQRPAIFDGSGDIVVTESFRGKLGELVLPTTIPFQSGIPPKLSTSMEERFGYDEMPEEAGVGASGYTGVIIDASHLKLTPSLTPVVFGQDGIGAYGAFVVSRKAAIKNGVVAYSTTSDPLALKSRVGDNPLIVRALSPYGSWRTDVIISTSLAQMVRATMRRADAANNCRLVIVMAQPTPVEAEGVEDSAEVEEDAPKDQ